MPDLSANLLPSPAFALPFEAPCGWRAWTPRDEISPVFAIDGPSARLEAAGRDYVHGKLLQSIPDLRAGQTLCAHVRIRKTGRCLARMRVAFFAQNGGYVDKFWTEPAESEGDWIICRARLTVPERAARTEIELCFTGRGQDTAWFDAPHVAICEPEHSMQVKIAVVHRERIHDNYDEALASYLPRIAEAAQMGAQFVLITELLSCRAKTPQAAEPLNGPIATALRNAARENAVHVVTSLPERYGSLVYNTAVLIGADGSLIGQYRKVHLPPQEIDGGTTEGDVFPVFDTGLGKVGLMVCYDYFFPETTFLLSQAGAQIVFLPIWGGHLQPGLWDAVTRARAVDNGVHFVASGIDVPSRIVDSLGNVVVERNEPGVSVGEVTLLDRKAPQLRVWPFSDTWPWRNSYMTERRNDTYAGYLRGAR